MQATGRKDPKIRRILKLRRKNKNRYGKRTIQDETNRQKSSNYGEYDVHVHMVQTIFPKKKICYKELKEVKGLVT